MHLPSMEGVSILRETELNDVIQDVKCRSEADGDYITYEELNCYNSRWYSCLCHREL